MKRIYFETYKKKPLSVYAKTELYRGLASLAAENLDSAVEEAGGCREDRRSESFGHRAVRKDCIPYMMGQAFEQNLRIGS